MNRFAFESGREMSVNMLTEEVIACFICMSILGTNQLINTLLNHKLPPVQDKQKMLKCPKSIQKKPNYLLFHS